MTGDFTLEPQLARHPDARRAKAPLVPPVLFPYLALILGSGVAALAACWNALMLRRGGLATRSLLMGLCGWIAFLLIVGRAISAGLGSISLVLILGRIVHFAFGDLLYAMHRHHSSGNQFLGGPMLPLVASYVTVFALFMFLPSKLVLFLLGVPLG